MPAGSSWKCMKARDSARRCRGGGSRRTEAYGSRREAARCGKRAGPACFMGFAGGRNLGAGQRRCDRPTNERRPVGALRWPRAAYLARPDAATPPIGLLRRIAVHPITRLRRTGTIARLAAHALSPLQGARLEAQAAPPAQSDRRRAAADAPHRSRPDPRRGALDARRHHQDVSGDRDARRRLPARVRRTAEGMPRPRCRRSRSRW